MKYLGVSCLGHDASLWVVEANQILWAAHSERYSGIKNDPFLNEQIVAEAFKYGPFDCTVYYERPLVKKLRNFVAGQYSKALSIKDIPYFRCPVLPKLNTFTIGKDVPESIYGHIFTKSQNIQKVYLKSSKNFGEMNGIYRKVTSFENDWLIGDLIGW